jgi:hypothetical protein
LILGLLVVAWLLVGLLVPAPAPAALPNSVNCHLGTKAQRVTLAAGQAARLLAAVDYWAAIVDMPSPLIISIYVYAIKSCHQGSSGWFLWGT